MPDLSQITLPDNTTYTIKDSVARVSIPYAAVDSTSTSTVFTATIPGITEYYDGLIVILYNGVVTSASNYTININGLGAYGTYSNMALGNPVTPTNPTRDTTIFNINYAMIFVFCSNIGKRNVTGWIGYRGYDANTNTIGYQLRTNNTVMNVSDTARYYKLYFTSADGTMWVPASVNSTNNATSARPVNQRPINPFGRIVYTSASTNYTAGSNLAATTIWSQYTLVLGYSFNRTGAALVLTVEKPVYVKCAPQTDGSAIMDADTPYVQELPSTADGKIYIYLGIAYDATHVELYDEHPVYWHDGTGIRLWSGSATADIDVDNALSATSENPVQNKVINSALNNKADSSALSNYLPKSGGEMTGGITYNTANSYFSIGNTWDYIYLDESNQSSAKAGIVADEISLNGTTVIAPTPTAGTNNTQIATTAFVNSALPSAATATPIVDGTGAVGTSAKYAREDHVHPKATYTASDVGALPDTTTIPSKTSDLTNDSGFITGMFIGSYGYSTYAEILAAYQANKVVYCRASSSGNPAIGSQKRMAFLAYVNNAETPTEFEFQYYRSVSTHTESEQGDQVYIYKINSTTGWSVTVRNAFSAVAAGTGLSRSYSNGTVTLSLSSPLPSVTSSDNGKVLTVVNGAWAAASLPTYNGGVS